MQNATPEQIYQTALKFHQEGKLSQAEQLYSTLIQVRPNHAGTWFYMGMIKYAKGERQEALRHLQKAVELDGTNPEYHNNIGEIYRQLGLADNAEAHFKLAIAYKPDYSDALSNLALVYKNKGDLNMAKLFFAEALEKNPRNVNAMINVGRMYQAEGEYSDAVECYIAAMGLSPENPTALLGAAFCLSEMGEYNTAAGMLSKLTAGKPEMYREKVDLAFLTLRGKDFRKGFLLLENRLKDLPILDGPEKTLWRGTSLKGKTLYVYYEEQGLSGLGDTIMFMRLLHGLDKYEPEKIYFRVQPQLLRLAEANVPACVEVIDAMPESYDLHCPLVSLALVTNLRAKTMPLASGYITADRQTFADIRDDSKKNVGIVFNTSKQHIQHERRSVPQQAFDSLAENGGLKLFYISAQEPDSPLNVNITDMRPRISDMMDTANIIASLDAVITPDTSVAHLAGAMGKKTLLLLNNMHDWRWFNIKNGEKTVWYESVTAVIRPEKETWENVLSTLSI